MRELFPHQQEALDYGKSVVHPALLMARRLGKTLVDVRLFEHWDIREPHLVLGPSKVMSSWEKELHLEGEHYIRAYMTTRAKRAKTIADAFRTHGRTTILLNYESLTAMPKIAQLNWRVVSLDESPYIKTARTKISKICCEYFRDAEHRVINTGLIAPESPLEVFQQFKFLRGSFMGYRNYWDFRAAVATKGPVYRQYEWNCTLQKRREIKKTVHKEAFVKTLKQAGFNVRRIYSTIKLEMTKLQAEVYQSISDYWEYEMEMSDGNTQRSEAIWATGRGLWLLRVAGGFLPDGVTVIDDSKIREIYFAMMTDFKHEPVVIFYKFRAELAHDLEWLTSKGIKCGCIHGGIKPYARSYAELLFNSGKIQALLCTISSVDMGKDFSKASVSFYRSNEPSCQKREQSEDRTYAMIKTAPLYCIDICSMGTVDEDLTESLIGKKYNAAELLSRVRSNHFVRKLERLIV